MAESDNRLIFRNTLYLYVRMGVMMLVRLYTVRIVLEMLGVDDYGLWNVITAFVTGFTFVSPALVSSTQRFLNFDMERGGANLIRIFSVSFELFLSVALLMVLLLETFGVWFLEYRMHIPPGQETAALWVFQCAVITLVVNMMRMPYESAIIATEKMSFYAVVCMFEAIILLSIVFVLRYIPAGSRLVAYGVLTVVAQTVIFLIYSTYCRRNVRFARLRWVGRTPLRRELVTFSGWNIFGSVASVLAIQGVNILMNIYFGLATNAAYGVCQQVYAAVAVMVVNLNKAASPRIVKTYAAGDYRDTADIVTNVGKVTFLLILMFTIPMMSGMDTLLGLWLKDKVPPEAAQFSSLILVQLLIVSFTPPMESAIFATGKIRNYQLMSSFLVSLNFFGTLLLYHFGCIAVSALWLKAGVEVLILAYRLGALHRLMSFDIRHYLRRCLLPALCVTAAAAALMLGIRESASGLPAVWRLIVSTAVFLPLYIILCYYLGLGRSQRQAVAKLVLTKLGRRG